MEIETLKKSHLKRNIIIGVVVVAVISTIILNFTRAKYRTTQSIPLVNGTINYTPYDLNTIAMYQQNDSGEYISIDTVPESGYQLNEEQSYCEVNGEEDTSISVSYDMNSKLLTITPMTTKGTKCYLYFDEVKTLSNEILAGKNIQTRSDFSTVLSTNTNGIIFEEEISDGTTYYFAGNTDENWVSFAGYYWRIIRINENGSIRIIYQGTNTDETGSNTQIGTSAFNSSNYAQNAGVGYMYQTGYVHGLERESTIKGILDEWYESNLLEYASNIDESVGFCGDRNPNIQSGSYGDFTYTSGGGTGTTETYYGAYTRLSNTNLAATSPTFECANDSDLYTTSESNQGNGILTYPIGLINIDEVAYAGGLNLSSNENYYLYTNQYYWTMSPAYFGYEYAWVFDVRTNGGFHCSNVNYNVLGIRPVINLRSDVIIQSGTGTASQPYIIAT